MRLVKFVVVIGTLAVLFSFAMHSVFPSIIGTWKAYAAAGTFGFYIGWLYTEVLFNRGE